MNPSITCFPHSAIPVSLTACEAPQPPCLAVGHADADIFRREANPLEESDDGRQKLCLRLAAAARRGRGGDGRIKWGGRKWRGLRKVDVMSREVDSAGQGWQAEDRSRCGDGGERREERTRARHAALKKVPPFPFYHPISSHRRSSLYLSLSLSLSFSLSFSPVLSLTSTPPTPSTSMFH